jgi:putative phosphoesterase
MRIAIVSDTHGRTAQVKSALASAAARQVDLILHCGDIDDGATVRLFPAHTHFVFGNCDRHDSAEIRSAVAEIGATLHDGFGFVEVEGTKIAFVHGDDRRQFEELIAADAFDFVFYGHSHVAEQHKVGRTRVVNPGALHRAAVKTFVLLELPAGTLESITVERE